MRACADDPQLRPIDCAGERLNLRAEQGVRLDGARVPAHGPSVKIAFNVPQILRSTYDNRPRDPFESRGPSFDQAGL